MANINQVSPDGGTTIYDLEDTTARNGIDAITDGQSIESFSDVETALETKADTSSLGTASTKNSTSVVTQSTDLVESGAVKDIVGWGNKNLLNPSLVTDVSSILWSPIFVGNGTFTLSTNAPKNTNDSANLFLLAGNVISGISTSVNGVWNGQTRTCESVDGYVTVVSRNVDGVNPKAYHNLLEKGSSATAYEPYHESVEQTLRDAESVIGTVEDGTNPTKAYAVGEHFIRNGKFCTVTVAVTTSSTWVEGSNYTSGQVGDVVYLRLDSSVSVSAGSFANVDFDSNIPFSSYDILGVSIQIAGSGGSANAIPRWVATSQANVRITILNLDSSNGYTWGVSVLLTIRVK